MGGANQTNSSLNNLSALRSSGGNMQLAAGMMIQPDYSEERGLMSSDESNIFEKWRDIHIANRQRDAFFDTLPGEELSFKAHDSFNYPHPFGGLVGTPEKSPDNQVKSFFQSTPIKKPVPMTYPGYVPDPSAGPVPGTSPIPGTALGPSSPGFPASPIVNKPIGPSVDVTAFSNYVSPHEQDVITAQAGFGAFPDDNIPEDDVFAGPNSNFYPRNSDDVHAIEVKVDTLRSYPSNDNLEMPNYPSLKRQKHHRCCKPDKTGRYKTVPKNHKETRERSHRNSDNVHATDVELDTLRSHPSKDNLMPNYPSSTDQESHNGDIFDGNGQVDENATEAEKNLQKSLEAGSKYPVRNDPRIAEACLQYSLEGGSRNGQVDENATEAEKNLQKSLEAGSKYPVRNDPRIAEACLQYSLERGSRYSAFDPQVDNRRRRPLSWQDAEIYEVTDNSDEHVDENQEEQGMAQSSEPSTSGEGSSNPFEGCSTDAGELFNQ